MTTTDKEAKVIDLQSYEFDKEFERLQDIVSSPDMLTNINIKNILNTLLTVNKMYHQVILTNLTALQALSETINTIAPIVNQHTEMFNQVSETLITSNDNVGNLRNNVERLANNVDRIIDLLPKE